MGINKIVTSSLVGLIISLTPNNGLAYDMTLDNEKRLVKMEDENTFKTEIEYIAKSDVPYKVMTFDYEFDYDAVLTFAAGGNLVIETRRFSDENKDIQTYVCEKKKCEDDKGNIVPVRDVSGNYFRLAQGFCYALPKRIEKNYTAFCGELLKR